METFNAVMRALIFIVLTGTAAVGMFAGAYHHYLCSAQCRGRCDLLVGHDQRHLLLAHSSDLVTTNNNRKKAISK